jgi:hypothetical protein
MSNVTPVEQPAYLTREEAAAYLTEKLRGPINAKQMSHWGSNGPRYKLFRGNKAKRGGGWGRWALYTTADLDTWAEAQLRDPFENDTPKDLNGTG